MEKCVNFKTPRDRGITLIALIITVIVILLLAGVAIASLNNTGLFGRVKQATEVWSQAQRNEQEGLNSAYDEMGNIIGGGNISSPNIPEVEEEEVTSRRRIFTKCRSNRDSLVRFRK